MKPFSTKSWLKLAIFIIAVGLIFYFFPRGEARHLEYEVGKPWSNSLLTAEFDLKIMPDSARVKHDCDSIDAIFEPIYKRQGNPEQAIISALKSDSIIIIGSRERIISLVNKIYTDGIIDSETSEMIQKRGLTHLRFIENSNITTIPVSQFKSPREAYKLIEEGGMLDFITKAALQKINLSSMLVPNVVKDNEETQRLYDEKIRKVKAPIGMILKGGKIIDRGENVTPQLDQIIKTHEQMLANKEAASKVEKYLTWCGQLLFAIIMVGALFAYLFMFRKSLFDGYKSLLCVMILVVGFYIFAAMVKSVSPLALYIVPFAILAIVLGVFFDLRTATFCLFVEILLCAPMLENSLNFILLQFIAGITAIYTLREFSRRSQLIRSAMLAFIAYTVTYIAIELTMTGSFESIRPRLLGYFGINAVLMSFAYLLIFILEKIFGFISVVTLVELSDINNPVLRELSTECPGTFQHSMAVSNLASDAAARVNANVPLVRTGALYHDIGKMNNPAFFTENQHGVNPHDALDPAQSAKIVIRHISDGLSRADKAKLPLVIKSFISEHHGKGKAKYFYNQYCLANPDENVDPTPFTYPGPNPQSLETSIMMMADSVEAASRSLTSYTQESISSLVNKIIDGQIADGLHNESPISFRDIQTIKEAFINRLRTMYHARISYPDDPQKKKSI